MFSPLNFYLYPLSYSSHQKPFYVLEQVEPMKSYLAASYTPER
jgi:hypothetical protein